MVKFSPEARAQLRAEQQAGRAAVAEAKKQQERERERERLRARKPEVRVKARKRRQAAIDAAERSAIGRAARRAALLAEIDHLPPTAYVSPRHAAALLGIDTDVLACWRVQRSGPRWFGTGFFVRYQLGGLIAFLRSNEAEAANHSAPNSMPRLVWPVDQPTSRPEATT